MARRQYQLLMYVTSLLALSLVATLIGFSFVNRIEPAIGTRFDEPFLRSGFYDSETRQVDGKQYRWLAPQNRITIPSLSSDVAFVELTLAHPQVSDQPLTATVAFSPHAIVAWQAVPEPRVIHALAPTTALNGNLNLALKTNQPYQETAPPYRELGTVLFGIRAASIPQIPRLPVTVVALLMVVGLGFSLSLRLIGIRWWIAMLSYAVVLNLVVVGLAQQRSLTVLLLQRLTIIAILSVILTWLAVRWLPRLFAKAHVALDGTPKVVLLTLALVTFWIKAGGLLHPSMIPIDVAWHMDKMMWIFEGRVGDLYGGGLNKLVMPVEWGDEKPIIPYSPMYHFFAASFRVLPWSPALTAILLNAITDTSYLFIIYFLTRKIGASAWAGIIAALVYATTPSTYLLHSWGNVPTTFGMWWTLLAMTWILAVWDKLPASRGAWWSLSLIFAAAFVFYTVMGVFLAMFMVVLLVALFAIRTHRPQARSVMTATLTGFGLAVAVFYWQYIIPTIRQTIPLITQRVAQGGQNLGEVDRPFSEYVFEQLYLWDIYGVYIPLIFGIIGWVALIRHFGRKSMITWMFASWIIVAVLWWFAGFKVDTVDKQLFWLIPAMSVGIGFLYDRVRTNQRWHMPFVVVLTGLLFYQFSDAIYLWSFRIKHVQGFTSLMQETLRWLGFEVRGHRS